METKRQRSTRLIINHPRIPYTVVPAKPVLPNNLMCIVELTNGFFRVLHINSGVTLTDTKGVAAAVKYISQVTHRLARDKPLTELFSAISWEAFCRYDQGVKEDNCILLFNTLEPYSSMIHNVSKKATTDERYLYPSEPII